MGKRAEEERRQQAIQYGKFRGRRNPEVNTEGPQGNLGRPVKEMILKQ